MPRATLTQFTLPDIGATSFFPPRGAAAAGSRNMRRCLFIAKCDADSRRLSPAATAFADASGRGRAFIISAIEMIARRDCCLARLMMSGAHFLLV